MCGNERIFGRFAGDLFVFGNLTNIMKRLYIYINLCYNKIERINMDFCHRQFCDGKRGYCMCNSEEKCQRMREVVLRKLTDKLKEAKRENNANNCKKMIGEISGELENYDCEAVAELKKWILRYREAQFYPPRILALEMIISQLEEFLKN